MLCFRCEHRARNLDAKLAGAKYVPQPRCECGDIGTSKASCYMFMPCLPVVTKPANTADPRPRFAAPMISSREWAQRVMSKEELSLKIIYQNEETEEVALAWDALGVSMYYNGDLGKGNKFLL